MARKKKEPKAVVVDTKAGSLAYNRYEMQASQALHMAIELFPNLDYLLVLDHYDDITVFDSETAPETVSYYQMKTNEQVISIDTAISENWLAKLYENLERPDWIVQELGLITNCPLNITVSFKGDGGKKKKKITNYTAEKTPFSDFDPTIIEKIKVDIAKRKSIAAEDVDLSKFVHMRTTLSIPKHKEIVEQEMGEFLHGQYPKITIDTVKTIFGSMMDLLARRQSYELLDSNAVFSEVRKHKGVAKNELARIIDESMSLSVPPFEEIERILHFASDDEKFRTSYAYTQLCSDLQKKSESFDVIYRQVRSACASNAMLDGESASEYGNRIYASLPSKSPVYDKHHVLVLIACVLINEWRRQA